MHTRDVVSKDSFPYDISKVPLKLTFSAQITEYTPKSTLRWGSAKFDDQHHGSVPFKMLNFLLDESLRCEVRTTSRIFASMEFFSHLSIQKMKDSVYKIKHYNIPGTSQLK